MSHVSRLFRDFEPLSITARPARTLLSRLALTGFVFALAPLAAHATQAATTTTLTAPAANMAAPYTASATTLTATVSSGTSNLTQGIVFFCDDISTGATAGACGTLAYLGQTEIYNGTATLKVRLGSGQHKLYAKFQPTSSYSASTSLTTAYTVSSTVYPLVSDVLTASGSAGSYTLQDVLYGVRGNPLGTAANPATVTFTDTTTSATVGSAQSVAVSTAGVAPPVTFTNGSPTAANILVKGDFNDDGYIDVAIFSTTSTTWSIAYGSATGFSAPVAQSLILSATPLQAAAGDFLGSGYSSVVFTTAAKSIVVLANNGGTFTASTLLTSTQTINAIGVGDFTLDGCLDIVVSASTTSLISVYAGGSASGACTGSLSATAITSNGVTLGYGMVVADFNGDGAPDFAITGNGKVEVHTNVGIGGAAGTFNNVSGNIIPNGNSGNPTGITAADLKGDGVMDILYTAAAGVGVILNNGGTVNGASVSAVANTAPFSTAAPSTAYSAATATPNSTTYTGTTYSGLYNAAATTGLSGIAAGDFDGNGTVDVAAGSNGSVIYILNGDTSTPGTLDAATSYPGGVNPYSLAVGDFAGTGSVDIAAVNDAASSTLSILFPGQTATVTVTSAAPGAGPQTISATYTPSVAYYSATTSNAVTLSGGTVATSTALFTSPATTQVYGSPVTLTATVSAASALVGGAVQFYENGTAIGSAQTVNTTTGVATLATSALPPGNLSLTAVYSGSSPDESSSSVPVGFTVTETVSSGAGLAFYSPVPPSSVVSGGNIGVVLIAEKDAAGNIIPTNADSLKVTISGTNFTTVAISRGTINGVAAFDLTPYTLLAVSGTTANTYTFAFTQVAGTITSTLSASVQTGTNNVYEVVASTDTTASTCNLIYASTTANAGCQLRDAFNAVNTAAAATPASIFMKPSLATITLTSSLPVLTSSLNFFGYGAANSKINGGTNKYNMFQVNSTGVNLSVSGVLLNAAKAAADGGAILMGTGSNGSLTVSNTLFYQNTATTNGGSIAVEGSGNVTISNTTVYATASTSTPGLGGGVYAAGSGTVTISNSTFYLNTATKGGGGIYAASGTVNLIDDTIVGNATGTTYAGGGVYKAGPATVNLQNTVVEANTGTTTLSPDVYALSGAGSYSASGSLASTANGTSPYTLATLGLATNAALPAPPVSFINFGATSNTSNQYEFALLPGSPLLGAGLGSMSYPTDQRGFPRPTSGAVDIGALQDTLSLSFTTQAPATGTVGVALTPAPVVAIFEDAISIQVDATSLSVITGTLNPGSFTSASSSATESSTGATFYNLIPATAAAAATLTASAAVGSAMISAVSTQTMNISKTSSTTTLTPASQTISFGSSAGVTAAVASAGYTPTGTVNFYVDGSGTVGATCTLAGGTCTASIPGLSVMASPGHSVTATYIGDAGATTSSSTGSVAVIVTTQTSTVVLTPASQTSTTGSASITAAVSGGAGATPSGGTITLTDSVAGSGPYIGTASAGGTYVFNLTGLAGGTHSFTATYAGDSNTAASDASAAVTVTVSTTVNSTTTYVGTTSTSYGMLATLGVNVSTATANPTGTVTFNGTGLSTAPTCMLGSPTGTSESCSVNVGLPAGTYNLTINYPGDTNTNASSTMATLTVTQAVLTITGTGTNRPFNTANSISYAVSGYQYTDSAANVFITLPTSSTTATRDTSAGTATVVPTGGSLSAFGMANYALILMNGTFSITGGAPQGVLFDPLPNFASGGSYQMTARSTSGLTASYTVSGPATVSGAILTVTGPGLVTVTASTVNDSTGDYAAPASVSRSFTAQ